MALVLELDTRNMGKISILLIYGRIVGDSPLASRRDPAGRGAGALSVWRILVRTGAHRAEQRHL